jgi:hypothetical protein
MDYHYDMIHFMRGSVANFGIFPSEERQNTLVLQNDFDVSLANQNNNNSLITRLIA